MLLFILNLEGDAPPPVESTDGAVLIMDAPVAIDHLEASVVLLQIESQIVLMQAEGVIMGALEAEV